MPQNSIDILWKVFLSSSYHWNIFALPVFITAAIILFFGLSVLIRERYSAIGTAFFLMTLPACVWLFSFTAMYSAHDPRVALWWAKAAYVGVPFIPSTIYYFTVRVLRLYGPRKEWVWVNFILSAVCSGVIIGTDLIIQKLGRYAWGYYPEYELYSIPYLVLFFGVMALSLWNYWQEFKKPQTETHKARIKSLLTAFSIAYIAIVDFLPKFGIAFYPCGYLGILGFIVIAAHVMKKYRLVDVTPSLAIEQIIGTMGDALLVLDSEDIIRVANQAACSLFELNKKNIIGMKLSSISPAFPSKDTVDSLERSTLDQHYEMHHALSDGRTLVLNVSESVMKDDIGCVIATVLIIRDITMLKRTQIELLEIERRFNELYNEMPDAIILLDEFGKFRSANPAAERLLGRRSKELSGKIFVMSNLLPPSSTAKILKVIRGVMESGREEPFEMEIMKEDRSFLTLTAYASGVREDGKIVAVQIILRESVEQKKLNEVAEKIRSEIEANIRRQLEELARNHQELRSEIDKFKFFG